MQTSTNYPRLGIMGGTFDPIHHGHLVAASEVADLFSLDRVLFVPTGQPWQKKNRSVTPAEDRYLMTTIATGSNPRFSVSRVDIDRGGPTYTVDTLHDLHERYPNAELFFITGADAVARMATWRDCSEMMSLATFVAVTRPGYSLEKTELGPLGNSVTMVEVPAMAISSTNIRARARANRPIWYLVPDGVVQYIAKERLYQSSGQGGELGMW
ncbi:nicotinate-nucleotide adenylyltransferase [Corynebacterium sp. 23_3061]